MFDGHGGVEASAFAAAQLPLAFANFLDADVDKDSVAAFENAFNAVDQQFAIKSKREVNLYILHWQRRCSCDRVKCLIASSNTV